MLRLFALAALAALAALVAACAIPGATEATDPMHQGRGSTPAGASKAADLGFHGPIDRGAVDGPN